MVPRPAPTGLTTALWRSHVPLTWLNPVDLRPSQATLHIAVLDKLSRPHASASGDPYPHVIIGPDGWVIEDGHHRIAAAILRGQWLAVRVFAA